MRGFLVLHAPLSVILTELPVRVELDTTVTPLLGIAISQHHQSHILPGRHFFLHGLVVRNLVAEIPPTGDGTISVNQRCNPVIGNTLR